MRSRHKGPWPHQIPTKLRHRAALLLKNGWTMGDVARDLGISVASVYRTQLRSRRSKGRLKAKSHYCPRCKTIVPTTPCVVCEARKAGEGNDAA